MSCGLGASARATQWTPLIANKAAINGNARLTVGLSSQQLDAAIKAVIVNANRRGVPPARQLRDHGGPSDIDCRQDRRGDLRRQLVLAPGVTTLTRLLLTLTLAAAGILEG